MSPLHLELLGFSRWEQEMNSLPFANETLPISPAQPQCLPFAETGVPEQHSWEIQQVLARLKGDLQDLRGKLTEYGPSWYDEEEDARLAASLRLIERIIPAS
jgi:hypothetical protein